MGQSSVAVIRISGPSSFSIAKKLTGTKNFGTFRASNCGSKSPIKTLKSVKINLVLVFSSF